MRRGIKVKATENPFTSAAEIVENALQEDIGVANITVHPTLPKPVNLCQQANRKRKLTRPNHPLDLQFVLDHDHFPPDFFKKDVHVDQQRHVVFASDQMLTLLHRARNWYLDATFKLVREPFMQLFSIHSFVKCNECIKQVPLTFAMMSSRRMEDYVAVLEAVIELLPEYA
ncbi:uncharacterized protein LOC117106173, partial [Anneissia japonica]|uniref:uncharacterized protein LOC117106173 n=1 Tax=Anneissia japonica TaxID=1529436 RepID=UPI0014256E15